MDADHHTNYGPGQVPPPPPPHPTGSFDNYSSSGYRPSDPYLDYPTEMSGGSSIHQTTGPQLPPFPQPMPGPIPNPDPKKRRRTLWAVISSVVALFLIGSGIAIFTLFMSTPAKTLTAFCTDLQSGDYQSAYNQLSSNFQSKVPETTFANFFTKVSSCSNTSLNQSGATANAVLILNQANNGTKSDTIVLAQNGGFWKVDDESRLSSLTRTLDGSCVALQKGDYSAASKAFSSNLQKMLSQSEFSSFLANATICSYTSPILSGNGATTTLTLVPRSKQAETHQLALSQNSSNNWQIDSMSNFPDLVLDTFCSDLQSQSFQEAYNLTSSLNMTEPEFVNYFPGVTSCAHDPSTASNGNAIANTTIILKDSGQFDDQAIIIKDSNGNWKINDLQDLPNQTLNTFCDDVHSGSYQVAYALLTNAYKQGVYPTEQAFEQNVANSTCTHQFPFHLGGDVAASFTLTDSQGNATSGTVFLVKDNKGNWLIDDFRQNK